MEDGNDISTRADTDSITSDPTELYHRDIATQTSPEIEHEQPAVATGSNTLNDNNNATSSTSKSIAAIRTHSSRLDLIAFQLRQCLTDDMRSKVADDSRSGEVVPTRDLQEASKNELIPQENHRVRLPWYSQMYLLKCF